jgi:hypothetical protein
MGPTLMIKCMVDLDPLYQLFQPKNAFAVYKLLQQLCMGMQETSHLEVFVPILHTMQLWSGKKRPNQQT